MAPTSSIQVAVVSLWTPQREAKPLGFFPFCFLVPPARSLGLTHVEGLAGGEEHQESVWGQGAVSAWGCRGGERGQARWEGGVM